MTKKVKNNVIPDFKNHIYQLHDYWDRTRKVPWPFDHALKRGEVIENDGVEYVVVKKNSEKRWAVIRMTRYKIPNTSSQFVHKCPAKKDYSESLSQADIIKLQKKHGKEQTADIMNERVKIRAVGAQLTFGCPYCKVTFWRETFDMPPPVMVDPIMGKKQLRKRTERHAN